jgi:hypothetical protein
MYKSARVGTMEQVMARTPFRAWSLSPSDGR